MTNIEQLLGKESQSLLTHTCRGINTSELHLPGSDYIDRGVSRKNRKPSVLRNHANLYQHGRLAGTGYDFRSQGLSKTEAEKV